MPTTFLFADVLLGTTHLSAPNVESTVETIAALLQGLAQDSSQFDSIFHQSFGSGFNTSLAETIRGQWAL